MAWPCSPHVFAPAWGFSFWSTPARGSIDRDDPVLLWTCPLSSPRSRRLECIPPSGRLCQSFSWADHSRSSRCEAARCRDRSLEKEPCRRWSQTQISCWILLLISLNDGGKRFCDVSLSKLEVLGNPYTRPHAGSMEQPGHVCAWKDAAKQRRSPELPTTSSSHALCEHTHHWAGRVGVAAGRVLIVHDRVREDTGIFSFEDGMRIKVFLASDAAARVSDPRSWGTWDMNPGDKGAQWPPWFKFFTEYGGTVATCLW